MHRSSEYSDGNASSVCKVADLLKYLSINFLFFTGDRTIGTRLPSPMQEMGCAAKGEFFYIAGGTLLSDGLRVSSPTVRYTPLRLVDMYIVSLIIFSTSKFSALSLSITAPALWGAALRTLLSISLILLRCHALTVLTRFITGQCKLAIPSKLFSSLSKLLSIISFSWL